MNCNPPRLGAAGYATIFLQDPQAIEPIATLRQEDGTVGYHSVLLVRADSPYRTLADLRGRSLAFTERLSTSGFLIPYYELTKQGYEPDRFFGRLAFSGSHAQAVADVLNGQADAGVTWSSGVGDHANGYSQGHLRRMVDRGLLDMDDVRILWTSELIPSGPIVVRKDLPQEAKEIFRDVLLTLADRDRQCFERIIGDGAVDFETITHDSLQSLIDIRRNGRERSRLCSVRLHRIGSRLSSGAVDGARYAIACPSRDGTYDPGAVCRRSRSCRLHRCRVGSGCGTLRTPRRTADPAAPQGSRTGVAGPCGGQGVRSSGRA